jgi:hypothetical protein
MGEFDAFEAGCTGLNCHLNPNWETDTKSLLSFSNTNEINWAYFSYYSLGTPLQTPIPHSTILDTLEGEIPAVTPIAVTCRSASVVVGSSSVCEASAVDSAQAGKLSGPLAAQESSPEYRAPL